MRGYVARAVSHPARCKLVFDTRPARHSPCHDDRLTRDLTGTGPARRLAAAAVVGLSALLSAAGCGESDDDPLNRSLAQLVLQPESHDGELVRTGGVVASSGGDPDHHWVEDPRSNRVGLAPGDEAAPFVGTEVTVVGRFSFEPEDGRQISIDSIEPAGDEPTP